MPRPLEENLADLSGRIELAARQAGRSPREVSWIAVTKNASAEQAAELVRLGVAELGENRADELERKVGRLAGLGLAPRWHFVGHLQANKARRVVRHADVIQSIDSLALLERVDRIAAEEGRKPSIFLQVGLTGEEGKHGFPAEAVADAVRRARDLANVELRGLMVMGPLEQPAGEATRAVFAEAARVRSMVEAQRAGAFPRGRCELSMGMSGDLELAIRAGSDLLRIGSALFSDGSSEPTLSARERHRGGRP